MSFPDFWAVGTFVMYIKNTSDMANTLRDEDLKLNIIVNGDKAKKELGDLEKQTRELKTTNKDLRLEKQKLEREGKKESDRYKEITAQIKANNSTIKSNENRMTALRKEIGLTGLTMKQLRAEQKRLKQLMDNTTPGTAEWKKYRGELTDVNKRLGQVRLGSNKVSGAFRLMKTVLPIAGFTALAFQLRRVFDGFLRLDDQLADVRKTTGLTRNEVLALDRDLTRLNTRTPREELLKLAEEAGRLGKKSRKDVLDFVTVANKISVALGDDLQGNAEEAIRTVGKLNDLYNVGAREGVGYRESMEKVGSVINEVSANSNAQASYLIEYTKRLGGVADQADIGIDKIVGYAATLDQFGQTVEMSATAQSKILVNMFQEPGKYADIAGVSVKEFTNLLDTDANEAFILFLEGLNGNNEGLSRMATLLDGLGVDGSRATQVLATLAGNTDTLRKQQSLANEALEKGTSLTEEYSIKNENLAGSYNKIVNGLRNAWLDSRLLKGLTSMVSKVAEWVEIPLADTIREEQIEVNRLVKALMVANPETETRKKLIEDLQENYPDYIGNIDLEKASYQDLKTLLADINIEFEKRIRLAVLEEELAENIEKSVKLDRERYDLAIQYGHVVDKYLGDRADDLNDQEKYNELLRIRNELFPDPTYTGSKKFELVALNNTISAHQEILDINEKLVVLDKEHNRILGDRGKIKLKETEEGLAKNTRKTVGNKVYEWDGNQWNIVQVLEDDEPNKELQAKIESIEDAYDQEREVLEMQYILGKKTQDEYYRELLNSDLEYFSDKLALYEAGSEEYIAVINQMRDKQREYEDQQIADIELPQFNEEEEPDDEYLINKFLQSNEGQLAVLQSMRDNDKISEEEYQDGLLKIREKGLEDRARLTEQEKGVLLDRTRAYQTSFGAIADLFGQETAIGRAALIAKQAMAAAEIAIELGLFQAKTGMKASEATVDIAAGQAKSAAAAPFPFNIPLIIGFLAQVAGIIKTISAARKQGKSVKKGFAKGGYTGDDGAWDEPAGVVHKKEFVANRYATGNPEVKQILDVIDTAQKNGSIKTINLDTILKSLPVGGRMMDVGGYAREEPSYTSPQRGEPFLQGNIAPVDERMTTTLNKMADVMDRLERNGLKAFVNKYGINSIDDAINGDNSINDFNKMVGNS